MDGIHDNYESSMNHKYLFGKNLGMSVNPTSANQIGEIGKTLNQGVNNVEFGPIDPRVFDSIPKEHFKEIGRLGKVTGSKMSLHAPIIDVVGFTQEGWDESHRLSAEKQIESVVERAHEIDPKGNVPITIHGGTSGAYEWMKPSEEQKKEFEKHLRERGGYSEQEIQRYVEHETQKRIMTVVNQDSGKVTAVKYDKRYSPLEKGGTVEREVYPREFMDNLNHNEWDRNKFQLIEMKKNLQEMKNINMPDMMKYTLLNEKLATMGILSPEEKEEFKAVAQKVSNSKQYEREVYQNAMIQLREMHNNLKKYSPDLEEGNEKERERNRMAMERYAETLKEVSKGEMDFTQATDKLIDSIMHVPAPKVWKPTDDFSVEKASLTLGEVAANSYKKFGKTSPMLCLENVYPEMPLSRADSIRDTIEKAREIFVDKLIKEQKVSKEEAKQAAKSIIGATWDVGHINQLRKSGFSEEDILEETKKIAPYVKHAHITDNFGYSDSHLPPGMGNVPIKKMMEELEKSGFSGREILEIGGFAQNFPEEGAYLPSLEGMGSPLYSISAPPYWDKISYSSGQYFSGLGEIYPKQHFDMYGSGFSTLPRELGGDIQSSGKSRFSESSQESA